MTAFAQHSMHQSQTLLKDEPAASTLKLLFKDVNFHVARVNLKKRKYVKSHGTTIHHSITSQEMTFKRNWSPGIASHDRTL